MYNNNSGNVGIGTNSPNYMLEVLGDIRLSGNVRLDVNKEVRLSTGRLLSLSTPNRLVLESFQTGQDLWLRGPGGIQFL